MTIKRNESIASMQSGQIPHFCNPMVAAEICKKLSKHVRVEEKWIILPDAEKEIHLDVYKYHGDIFTSTFKNRLETICSMPENDIRYLVGNEPLNTLSRHYEALNHPDIQNMLFIGIERWASQYLPYFGKTKFGEISDSKELTDSTTIGPYRQGVSSTEICVNNNKKNNGETLSLEIDADYGYEIEIQFFD